ncbi:hypothetical protein LMG28614_00235 [Paraburkholderia ultramafica]|uniref:Uncharacterized protein n=1 Tax=Paraburkholderia ultramafica TaxID=1544867 RepID=A0A6S7CBW2_9BURK|nr:hypothetical protein [Paraburkholderia ultramafica]CAB3776540.1 hypothetical protein LMG28614_00235 [Paraburkholderia ultramafica]
MEKDAQVLRYAMPIKQPAKEQVVTYSFGGKATWRFLVPTAGQTPRSTYVSCNGFSSAKAIKDLQHEAQNVWSDLITNHDGALLNAHELDGDEHPAWVDSTLFQQGIPLRFHAMVMGGDQIYMDSIWLAIELDEPAQNLWATWRLEQDKGFSSHMLAVHPARAAAADDGVR